MSFLLQDLRYTVRSLAQKPGFTAAVILTLSLGIGANTTLFSLINAVLLRPPAIERPDEIVELFTGDYDGRRYGASSYLDYLDFRERIEGLTGIVAYAVTPVSMMSDGATSRESCMLTTPNYFSVLGITPHLGRFFDSEVSGDFEADPVAVIGYGIWQRVYGGNSEIIGRSITLNGQILTVIGVAPPGFSGTDRGAAAALWAPLGLERQLTRASYSRLDRGSPWLRLLGRLKAGTSAVDVQSQLSVIAGQLNQAYPEIWSDGEGRPRAATVLPESETRLPMTYRGDLLDYMSMLMVVVGLVLVIACANVANLMLARTIERRREIAVRLAVGVTRWRLIRQLLSESILLSLVAGASALLVMLWSTDLLMAFQSLLPVPMVLDVSIDWRILAFTGGVSVLSGLMFGVIPALQASGKSVMPILKAAATAVSGGSPGTIRLRYGLVIVQISLSLLLLAGAGLFLTSLQQAQSVDIGFNPDNTLITSFDLHQQGYGTESGSVFYSELLERIARLANVESVSLAATVPLGGGPGGRMISLDAGTGGSGGEILMNLVGPDYFRTTQTPLVSGRGFSLQDRVGAAYTIVVNETFAQAYQVGQDPLNQRIRLDIVGEGAEFEIIGVARDGKYRTLEERPTPLFYLPMLQHIETLNSLQTATTLLVRTAVDPMELETTVRSVIGSLDEALALFNTNTLANHISVAYLPVRFGSTMLGLFGLLALLISSIGLYGIMAYTVNQHAHGIALRIALGAQRRDILKMILGQTLLVTFIGIGIGLAVAFAVTPVLTRYLYGVTSLDPWVLTAIGLLLAGVALLAGYLPARRAMNLEPMQVLRYE
jgi:macrolide transport system ATP-binding/permease protein